MPNWTVNKIFADPAVISALLNEQGDVDFERIIPIPAIIPRESMTYEDMIKSNGRNWRDWCIEHWDTKWNASSTSVHSESVVEFQTAWSHPAAVVRELSKLFPEHEINVHFADEDLGAPASYGEYQIRGGVITRHIIPPPNTEEAREFACQIFYGCSYEEVVGNEED